MTRPIIALLALALLAPGCAGTDVGNPQTTTRLELLGAPEQLPQPNQRVTPGFTILEAWVVIDRIGLGAGAGCDEVTGRDGLLAVELMTGTELPETPEVHHPSDSYCSAQLHLATAAAAALPEGAPAELAGNSVYIKGVREDGTDFEVFGDFKDIVRLEAPQGGSFGLAANHQDVLVVFAFDRWFDMTAILNAEQTDGAIRIDATTNSDILETFRPNLRAASYLFRDYNANGEFEISERGPALAKGASD